MHVGRFANTDCGVNIPAQPTAIEFVRCAGVRVDVIEIVGVTETIATVHQNRPYPISRSHKVTALSEVDEAHYHTQAR
mgnify:CR=1 FL=1